VLGANTSFIETQFVLSLGWLSSVFRETTSLCYSAFQMSSLYGVMQSKLIGGAEIICKSLEDVVGNVHGFLVANK